MRLTEEQVQAVEAFRRGGDLKVIAYAGAGKTSTLAAMASSSVSRGIYIAFNRAIAREALMPANIESRTAHSLAYRAVKQLGYSDDKMRTAPTARRLPAAISSYDRALVVGTIRR